MGDVVCFSATGQAWVIALVCLYATAILASAVAHGRSPYGFEDPAIRWLGPPSATRGWADLAELLAAPTIIAVLVVSFGVGLARRGIVRVAFYAALAAWALLISDQVIKPLVQRTYYGELTFPSGNVTAVSRDGACHVAGTRSTARLAATLRNSRPRRGVDPPYVAGSGRRALAHPTRRHRVRVAVRWCRHCRCCCLRTRRDSRTLRGYGMRSSWRNRAASRRRCSASRHRSGRSETHSRTKQRLRHMPYAQLHL